jgi:hypothetical protein
VTEKEPLARTEPVPRTVAPEKTRTVEPDSAATEVPETVGVASVVKESCVGAEIVGADGAAVSSVNVRRARAFRR